LISSAFAKPIAKVLSPFTGAFNRRLLAIKTPSVLKNLENVLKAVRKGAKNQQRIFDLITNITE
jgi:hypothetical protein